MLDSRLTREDGYMSEGGVKKKKHAGQTHPQPPPHHHHHHHHCTHTHARFPCSLQIMMLSATPVQTVRGSLRGVPQVPVIGLLGNPPTPSLLDTHRQDRGQRSRSRSIRGSIKWSVYKRYMNLFSRQGLLGINPMTAPGNVVGSKRNALNCDYILKGITHSVLSRVGNIDRYSEPKR